jgi:uncharacterized membrane protein
MNLFALLQDPTGMADTTRETWRLLEVPDLWVVVLVLVPATAAVAWLAYLKEKLGPRIRPFLIALRFAALWLLLLVLFRPVKVHHQETVKPAEVVILMDDSASMLRKDAYTGDNESRDELQALSGTSPSDVTRLELARTIIQKELLPALESRGYEERLFRFADSVTPLATLNEADGRGSATHLGDALSQALATHRGRHVTDIVVISDGRNNAGMPVLDAAGAAAAAGIPVHTIVVGDTRPEKNLVVELVEAPSGVLEGDEIAISVRVLARGAGTTDSSFVVLEEIFTEGGREDVRTVAEERVNLAEAGERMVLVAPPGSASIDSSERRFRVTVPPLPEETLLDDNSLEVSVHITSEKIRVLFVDGYPRWEYRFLNRLLKRADDRIQVQCYLMSATPNFTQESTLGLTPLRSVPTSRRELLDNYDVVILGDVNPYAISPDPAKGIEFVESLIEFVERGGGLCTIAGEYENPRALEGTEFAKLLPVVLDSTGALAFEADTRTEFRPSLEDPTNPHEIVRLVADIDKNRDLWEEQGGLRGFYWYYPVVNAKPGAQVLLRHSLPSASNAHGRYPLLVTGYYPSGRTMFLAVDSTWRWRYRFVDRYHERFWRNAMRWLALGRLRGGDRRYTLEPLRNVYNLDERVTLEARILDEDYRPSEVDTQEAFLQGPQGPPEELTLAGVDGRPGLFRGSFESESTGLFRTWIEIDGQRVTTSEFEVRLPSRENADPSPDPATLASLAKVTTGRATSLIGISDLLAEFPGDEEAREPISSQLEDIWDQWGTLLLALLILSAEWILRKRHELI